MGLLFAAPALPLDEAGKYVAGAYVVFVAMILIYVVIMAIRLQRIEREVAELDELAARVEALDIARSDRTEVMRWDLGVHRAIYRAANNPHLEDVLIRYDNLATRIHCMFLDRLSTVDMHVVAEHVALLRAIAAGEADRADDLAREHVLGFERAIRAVI